VISGWRYRLTAFGGATALIACGVVLANTPIAQQLVTSLPVVNNLEPQTVGWNDIPDEIVTTGVIVLGALWPLFKPRPRRIVDTVMLVQKRVLLAATGLATLGYFDWSTRLPRTTLILTTAFLAVCMPLLFVSIRRRPRLSERAILVGDDGSAMRRLREAAEMDIIGYVAPAGVDPQHQPVVQQLTDGGHTHEELPRLGGLSGLRTVLLEHDIDTVLLGFAHPDREEFFGTLSACHERGIEAKVHRDHADTVLAADGTATGELVTTNLAPWDLQDYALKRAFDVVFAGVALLVLAPIILVIAVAIRLDSPGPILYSQQRTASFGNTFTIYKFRSMVVDAEAESGATLSPADAGEIDPRITSVGRLLRTTHLDEIPQLWSVLLGRMSVVGPRPERPELDANIESTVAEWRSRWFVKPGLTGLAQINDVTGHDPQGKLRYDIEYIRDQSLTLDTKIVIRQLYLVVVDAVSVLRAK